MSGDNRGMTDMYDDEDDYTPPAHLDTSDPVVFVAMIDRALANHFRSVPLRDAVRRTSTDDDMLEMALGGYTVIRGDDVAKLLAEMERQFEAKKARDKNAKPPRRQKSVNKALELLEKSGPDHPSLETHRYEDLDDHFGAKVYQSYVESNTPNAWRMWWFFGPGERTITVAAMGEHPKRSIASVRKLSTGDWRDGR